MGDHFELEARYARVQIESASVDAVVGTLTADLHERDADTIAFRIDAAPFRARPYGLGPDSIEAYRTASGR